MKKHLQLLGLFLSITIGSFAQLTQGKISYTMEFSTESENMAAGLSMMQNSRSELYFMPGKSRSEVIMGALTHMTTIANEKSKKVVILMDMLGTKSATKTTVAELKEQNKEEEPKVEILNETKEILGYSCTKAIVSTGGETPRTMEVWFTKDIVAFTDLGGQTASASGVPGVVLESTVAENDIVVKLTATSVDKTVDKKLFKLKAPKDHEMKTLSEMMDGN